MRPQHFVGIERGVVSEEDLVRRESSGRVDPIIMHRRGQCEPVCPSFRVVRGDQPEVLFDPLVLSFG